MIDRSPTHTRMQERLYIFFFFEIVSYCKKGVAESQDYCIIARKDLKIPVTYEESCISEYRYSYVDN